MAELQDKSKAQEEQIDALHKQIAELKMRAGGKLFVEDAGAAALFALTIMPETHTGSIKADLAAIAKAAAIPPLVALMRDGTDQQKPYAAAALGKLAYAGGVSDRPDHLDVAIAQAGGIEALVALVRDGNAEQKANAAAALKDFCRACDPDRCEANHNNQILIAEAGGIPPLVALVRDGNAGQKRIAADALKLLAVHNRNNGILIQQAGIVI